MTGRTFGVEEEFLLVDVDTGAPTAIATQVLERAGDGIEKELQQQQIETDTVPIKGLDELRAEIVRLRTRAAAAAGDAGARLVAVGTSPLAVQPATTPVDRYEQMAELYRLTVAEQLTCGMHVHVETCSPEESVGALDRIRPWLPALLALSANSPFWQGVDTGYESFRSQAWSRWPTAGPTEVFGSVAAYHEVVAASVATGSLVDDGMIYYDARLGRGLPTLEVRVADVCLHADDAVLIAALTRALVDTAAREWADGRPAPAVRTEVLRLATWRASRSGVTDVLVHPRTGSPAPAWEVVAALGAHVEESLEAAGDLAAVDELLAQLRSRGTGSTAQRVAYARNERLVDVVHDAADRTTRFG